MTFEPEAVRRFADIITPPNWNVVLHPRDYRYKPGTLNVWLQILTEKEAIQIFALEGPFLGRVWGPMFFIKLSNIVSRIPEARRAFEKYGDGSVARVHIQLCPSMRDWRLVVVHELAHVAVARYKARKMLPFKGEQVLVVGDPEEERHQGPLESIPA